MIIIYWFFAIITLTGGVAMTDATIGVRDFWSSSFCQDGKGRLYYIRREGAGSLFSKTILYRIDRERNTSEKIITIRDSRSKVFIDDSNVYFTYPDSWVSIPYGYGSYAWYFLPLDQLDGNKNLLYRYDQGQKSVRERTYISTINGLYFFENANDSGYLLFKAENGQKREVLKIEPNQYFDPSYTCMHVVERSANAGGADRLLCLWNFETQSPIEITSDSRWTNAIIAEDAVYYEQYDNVSKITNLMCLDLKSNSVECLFQDQDIKNLAYDDSYLYAVTRDSIIQFQNGEQTKVLSLPHEWGITTDIIVFQGDFYMSDNSWDKIYVMNIDTENTECIGL